MHSVYSRVESVGPDEHDPASFVVHLAPAAGLVDPTLRIASDHINGYLAIVGVTRADELVGLSVRVSVASDEATERVEFLPARRPSDASQGLLVLNDSRPANEVTVYDLVGYSQRVPAGNVPAADASPSDAEAVIGAEPTSTGDASAGNIALAYAAATAAPTAEAAADKVSADEVPAAATPTADVPVEAAASSVDSSPAVAGPIAPDNDCPEAAPRLTPEDLASEERARVEIAAAAQEPVEQRFFLYRETYGKSAHGAAIELTPEEFAALGGPAYVHLEDCGIANTQFIPADVAQDIERLLARTIMRPETELSRTEVEHLAATGRVVSVAVY